MVPQRTEDSRADLIIAESGAAPDVTMLNSRERLPWAGHSARYALGEMYELIKAHRTTLVFVNTRSQAEGIFQDLWHIKRPVLRGEPGRVPHASHRCACMGLSLFSNSHSA